jgi:hypothetical protein
MGYVEFRLSVPISELDDDESHDCAEVVALFAVLGISPAELSLNDQYRTYCDWTEHNHGNGRVNRGDVRIYRSETESKTFLSVDMFNEATDWMATVELCVCCCESVAGKVLELLQAVHDRAEFKSALLSGNLGIQEELALQKFPRKIRSGEQITLQHVQVYYQGKLEATSRFSLQN